LDVEGGSGTIGRSALNMEKFITGEHGFVAENEHESLAAFADKHSQHLADIEKDLEGLSSTVYMCHEQSQLCVQRTEPGLRQAPPDMALSNPQTAETLPASHDGLLGARFRILRPHAEGGLGKVSVAQDVELNREVALKEMKFDSANMPDSRARFLQEAEITGGLEHPGIVPVYGMGQYGDGRPFYAMRFIRGDSLKVAVDCFHSGTVRRDRFESVEFRELLGRFMAVCHAVEYAHSRGVLHRDLKPANIMLGKYGETLVVDWGLAKTKGRTEQYWAADEHTLEPRPARDSAPTQMGSAVGTPAFMSPEQARGQLDALSPASDVYSLGATLYYLLVGRVPFNCGNVGEVLRRARAGEFPKPRSLIPNLPESLEAICMKAMAACPFDRYSTAADLGRDLERYLADESVSARHESIRERMRRLARRHRSLLLVTVLMLSAGFVLASGALAYVSRANQQARNAMQQVNELQDDIQLLELQLAGSDDRQVRKQASDQLKQLHRRIDDHFGSVPLFVDE
jgi:eukaryotic-like serine/threonine-protein kinase